MTFGQWLLHLNALDYGLMGLLLLLSLILVNRILAAIRNEIHQKNPYSGLDLPGPAVRFILAAFLTALGFLFLSPWMHQLLTR
ncbi:MAG: hypothetical protein GXO90_01030 [FCB group bacterium]|nr:hypothetical protein [FCB group bacterium]